MNYISSVNLLLLLLLTLLLLLLLLTYGTPSSNARVVLVIF